MARSPESTSDDATERIVVNIDSLEELSAIREAIDAIRDDLGWWLKNHRREQWLPVQPIRSMPVDPLAPDWADRLNTVTAADLPDPTAAAEIVSPLASAARSVAPDAVDEETQFCCEAPELQWTGDPQFPGVACKNCGYIVADCGSVVMQPSAHADPDPEPGERQRALFGDE